MDIVKEIPSKRKAELNHKEVLSSKKMYETGRRIQDILLSLIAIVGLSPLMLLTALAILIDDPKGSPIFAQERVGRGGKPFRLLKFRSMCVDAEDKLAALRSDNEMDGRCLRSKTTRASHGWGASSAK